MSSILAQLPPCATHVLHLATALQQRVSKVVLQRNILVALPSLYCRFTLVSQDRITQMIGMMDRNATKATVVQSMTQMSEQDRNEQVGELYLRIVLRNAVHCSAVLVHC